MRPKKDYKTILAERTKDVETLLLYFNITRVRQYYTKRDGTSQFVVASWQNDIRARQAWKNRKIPSTAKNRVVFGKLRHDFNEVHGIPFGLMDKVLGWYDRKRISLDDMPFVKNEYAFYEHGQKRYKGKLVDWWERKWIMKDKVRLSILLSDPRYDHVETIPGASPRVIKIIQKWEAANGNIDA